MLGVLAQATTSTTEVPRIVGEPLSDWVFWGAGLALLAVILLAGWLATRHMRRQVDPPG